MRVIKVSCFWSVTLLAVVLTTSPVTAQAPGRQLRLGTSAATGRVSFLTAADGGAIPVQVPAGKQQAGAIDFLAQHGQLFGVTDPAGQLKQQKVKVDALGYTHTTYGQVHRGVEVFSGVLRVHQNAAGQFTAANGDFYPIKPTLSTVATVDQATAQQTALGAVDRGNPAVTLSKLVIVDPGWYGDPAIGARLAYHIVVRDISVALEEAFFVDAQTGEIIDRWSLVHTAKNRQIYDGNGGSGLPGTLARAEGDGAVGSPADVNRAYDYYGDTYDYYFNAFGRDSVDGLGLTMVATVNSTAPPCPNAFWSGSLLQMVFCTGTVTDDIVGHELTHGVTQFSANLIYQNQSGQLNESYSDVFGEMVDLFNGDAAFAGAPAGPPFWPTHGTGPGLDTPNNLRSACSLPSGYPDGVRWLMGEDATAFGGAIRDMWDPPCMGDPDRANSPLQTCNPNDAGGVHSGSGVPNHAFAMLTDGKTFNGHTVAAIGPIKAGAVWYRALTVYLTPASDFADAYQALNQAAADLIGTTPNDPRTGGPSSSIFTASDATQVDEALLAAEMNTAGACGASADVLISATAVECTLRDPIFADDFEGGINGWTVSNSGPPTPYDWV
ncbi:MAG: M4 family metallopeptidase, partial [Phycisphaerae bacterium]